VFGSVGAVTIAFVVTVIKSLPPTHPNTSRYPTRSAIHPSFAAGEFAHEAFSCFSKARASLKEAFLSQLSSAFTAYHTPQSQVATEASGVQQIV